jgi:ABC-2 type transport system ATP-binding protein
MALVQDFGCGIIDVTTREADLEDVFVSLTTTRSDAMAQEPAVSPADG